MIPEERKQRICNYVNEQQAVTAAELMELCDASEATIRRDLNELSSRGLLMKVHGGAVAVQNHILSDYNIAEREDVNREEKIALAKYAASMIQANDLVFIDAGTTTSYIVDFVEQKNVTFVTNAIIHAKKISDRGYQVYLTGGILKASTEALVGTDCYESLQRYQFSLGFFGTNGVSHTEGYTTPDPEEAKIKSCALAHTRSPYVLCDHSKFRCVASVRFATYHQTCAIATGNIPSSYQKDQTMIYI